MQLTPEMEALAHRLAAKHREPNIVLPHPKVVIKNHDGSHDTFMMEKLSDDKYVPYCFGRDCGRTRRTEYGFCCPTCGNKMNYDLTHYNGNANVEYVGEPPDPMKATAGIPVPGEYWKFGKNPEGRSVAEHRLRHADREEWNKQVEARKQAKKEKKGNRYA